MGLVKATVPSTWAEEGVTQASDIMLNMSEPPTGPKPLQCDSWAPLTRWVFLWLEVIISLKSHGNASSSSR